MYLVCKTYQGHDMYFICSSGCISTLHWMLEHYWSRDTHTPNLIQVTQSICSASLKCLPIMQTVKRLPIMQNESDLQMHCNNLLQCILVGQYEDQILIKLCHVFRPSLLSEIKRALKSLFPLVNCTTRFFLQKH